MNASFQVTLLPGGSRFSMATNSTVLDAALAAGIVLPYQCRSGTCGMCKAQVVSGAVVQDATATGLTTDEQASGMRLLCCSRVTSDVQLECRELPGMPGIDIRKVPLRVVALERLANDVMRVRLQAPGGQPLIFVSGQYIDLLLAGGVRRSYSFAAPCAANPWIELHIRHLPGGLFTDQVFGKMKVRDVIRSEGPFGVFSWHADSNAPAILLASGTGFAPIKAILEQLLPGENTRRLTLYWGGRRPADLYQHALCEQWARDYPAVFCYVPVVSDATAGDNWQGRTGWVHQAVLADYPDLSGHEVYACGAPPMIAAARRDFLAGGLAGGDFYSDAFLSAADQ